MAHNVSNEYKQIIYSGDARNKLKLLFNNVELEEADRYCEKMTIKSRIVPNGAKIFSLNNFISKEVELILHDIDTSIIQDQVSISIGTLVGNNYEYVPIGIFNIENQPTNDKNKTTIKLRDNSVKFDFNYNAQPLIEENGGSATKLQILQDICTQAGVTCNITSFIGYLDEIGIYDNTVTARKYIADIAEQAGKIATINRSGELIFVDLNNLTTWEIPIEVVEKYESGTKFKVGKVVYEDGIVRYETEDSNDDTLFLDGSNDYINGEKVVEQASSSNNFYSLQDTGEAKLKYFQMEGKTIQETATEEWGKNFLYLGDNPYSSSLTITKLSNSSIQINGTATSNITLEYTLLHNKKLDNNNYTFSVRVELPLDSDISVGLTGMTEFNSMTIPTNVPYAFETSNANNGKTLTKLVINIPRDTVFEGTVMQFQLEQGTSMTSFAPATYTPGMPSPNRPSELVSVGYENLVNSTEIHRGINPNGNFVNDNIQYLGIEDYVKVKPNTTYTISFEHDIGGNLYVGYKDENGTFIIRNNIGKPRTFTTPSDAYYVFAYLYLSSGYETIDGWVMLEEGIQQHSYIPYGKYGIEVKTTGKNLFAPTLRYDNQTTNGVTLTNNDDGSFTLTGTATASFQFSKTLSVEEMRAIGTKLPVGTYKQQTGGRLQLYNYNGSWVSNTYSEFTTSQELYVRGMFIQITNGTTYNETHWYQIEQGTQASEYEEYKGNTYLYTLDNPLRSIGDTKDLLYIKNGMLYVERKIGKIVFDGSENWKFYANTFYAEVSDNYLREQSIICMSNYYNGAQNGNGAVDAYNNGNNTIEFYYPTNSSRIYLRDDRFTTANNFKTWLSTHNTEVQYIVAEPYIEELGVIEVPNTYEEITYIDISSNIDTNTYLQYRKGKTQVEAILGETNQFDIDSLKTGKILGNPAIDSYDLIQIHDKSSNLLKYPYYATLPTTQAGVTWNDDNGKIIASGTATGYSGFTLVRDIPVQANTNYRFYIVGTQTNVSIDISGTSLGINIPTTLLNNKGYIFNTGNATLITINVKRQNTLPVTANFYPMLVIGTNTSVDYKPYYDNTYTTLATNDLVYTGVLINTFDTQIGEEAKEQNVFVNGEETFKKWARTKIDNVEGTLTLQAGEINEVNGKLNSTTLQINSQGALLDVLANKSNIDVEYDSEGNPLNGEVREVTTTTGFKFNAEGMTIEDSSSNFKALHRNDGTYYKEGDNVVGQYTKDGSKQKDLELFGVYYYGKNNWPDTPMFVAQLYTDGNGEEGFGHFYNRGD